MEKHEYGYFVVIGEFDKGYKELTDFGFTIKEIDRLVKINNTDLLLRGVDPTKVNELYSYIVKCDETKWKKFCKWLSDNKLGEEIAI